MWLFCKIFVSKGLVLQTLLLIWQKRNIHIGTVMQRSSFRVVRARRSSRVYIEIKLRVCEDEWDRTVKGVEGRAFVLLLHVHLRVEVSEAWVKGMCCKRERGKEEGGGYITTAALGDDGGCAEMWGDAQTLNQATLPAHRDHMSASLMDWHLDAIITKRLKRLISFPEEKKLEDETKKGEQRRSGGQRNPEDLQCIPKQVRKERGGKKINQSIDETFLV